MPLDAPLPFHDIQGRHYCFVDEFMRQPVILTIVKLDDPQRWFCYTVK